MFKRDPSREPPSYDAVSPEIKVSLSGVRSFCIYIMFIIYGTITKSCACHVKPPETIKMTPKALKRGKTTRSFLFRLSDKSPLIHSSSSPSFVLVKPPWTVSVCLTIPGSVNLLNSCTVVFTLSEHQEKLW